MSIKFKIGSMRVNWTFRHIWEENRSFSNYEVFQMRKRPELGIWYQKSKVVGPVKKGNTQEETIKKTFKKDNHVNSYMIGLKLIVCQTWITVKFHPILEL
jgi:hypothetical protein